MQRSLGSREGRYREGLNWVVVWAWEDVSVCASRVEGVFFVQPFLFDPSFWHRLLPLGVDGPYRRIKKKQGYRSMGLGGHHAWE